MGVDLTTYRLRIGIHYARAGRAKTVLSGDGKNREEWDTDFNPDKNSVCTKSTTTQLKPRQAKAGILVTTLFMAAVAMCVSQPSVQTRNLHDLSGRILIGGDISPNPGPAISVQTEEDLAIKYLEESMSKKWEQRFRRMEHKMTKRMEHIQTELQRQQEIVAEIASHCEQDHQQRIKQDNSLRIELNTLTENIDEIENKVRINEDQADKNENSIKKNCIKFFGLIEANQETYWGCLQYVLQVLRDAMPGVPWTEKDIIRVQRLGPLRRGQYNRPRPVIVEMATFMDKLNILRYGRDALRSRGVNVSSELTTRQIKTLKDLREEGHEAFFYNNKLWFRDNRRESIRDGPRHRRRQGRGRQTHPQRRMRRAAEGERYAPPMSDVIQNNNRRPPQNPPELLRDRNQMCGGSWRTPQGTEPNQEEMMQEDFPTHVSIPCGAWQEQQQVAELQINNDQMRGGQWTIQDENERQQQGNLMSQLREQSTDMCLPEMRDQVHPKEGSRNISASRTGESSRWRKIRNKLSRPVVAVSDNTADDESQGTEDEAANSEYDRFILESGLATRATQARITARLSKRQNSRQKSILTEKTKRPCPQETQQDRVTDAVRTTQTSVLAWLTKQPERLQDPEEENEEILSGQDGSQLGFDPRDENDYDESTENRLANTGSPNSVWTGRLRSSSAPTRVEDSREYI